MPVHQALAEARQLGMFTGPTWTVLLTTDAEPGAALFPFVVRARNPELAQVTAAAVVRMEQLHVVGVVPGKHLPVAGSHQRQAADLAAAHPKAHCAAAAVLDAHLTELIDAHEQPHTSHRLQRVATTARIQRPAAPDHAAAARGH